MVQISGKMLIARRRIIVGAMNSQAMARSERPRTRRTSRAGVAAERPPFLLHIGRGEPRDIGKRLGLVRRVGDHRDALPAKLRAAELLAGIDEEADPFAADLLILVEPGEEGEPVHLQRDLAR